MSREMKHSGFPWIGEIPSDWEIIPIKRVKDTTHPYPIGDGDHGSIKPEDYCDEGIPYIRVQNMTWGGPIIMDNIAYISEKVNELNKKSELHPHDILVAKTGATIGKTCIIPDDMPKANTTSSVGKITVGESYSSKFVFYLLGSEVCIRQMWLKAGQKSAQPGFNIDELVDFKISVPKDISTQQRIADYLDKVCGEADEMIALQEKMIEELKAYKQSVITEAVTKGLNPNAQMKDSGIDWIGEIPEHWEICRFKDIAKVKANLVHPNDYYNYPQIAPDNIEKGSGRLLPYKSVKEANVISDNHLFFKGQIIYSKIRPVLNKLIIAPFDGLCSADMYPIETTNDINYLKYYMLSEVFVSQVALVVQDRVKMPKINKDELGVIYVLSLPMDEQRQIASYLDAKCSDIDSLIAIKQQKIEELKEYKKSVIYEYVTGKKEVI